VREKVQIRVISRFARSYARMRVAGRVREGEMEYALEFFEQMTPLPPEWKDHPLVGERAGFREFHLSGAPDILVVYKLAGNAVVFTDIGHHHELFAHRKWKTKGVRKPGPTLDEIMERAVEEGVDAMAEAARKLKQWWRRRE